MADYREISQEYARGAILALTTINGGAAIAILTQAKDLLAANLGSQITAPLMIWATGVAASVTIWLMAFASTRYVDKSERETASAAEYLQPSDRYMAAGMVLFLVSLACFVGGCFMLAWGLGDVVIPAGGG